MTDAVGRDGFAKVWPACHSCGRPVSDGISRQNEVLMRDLETAAKLALAVALMAFAGADSLGALRARADGNLFGHHVRLRTS